MTPAPKVRRFDNSRVLAAIAIVVLTILINLLNPAHAQAPAPQGDKRPNVVILLADDVALMDFGAFGGEARTPNIDSLAARGAMFTRYRTSPLCSPSRAMLLTGVDNHRTGLATIPEVLPPEQRGKPGYAMRLEPGVATLATRLRDVGYRTYMTGKWHLGGGKGDLPDSHGFDRSFALEASGADNWEHKSYMPYYASAPWYEDGKPARFPKGVYSSTFIVDRMIAYLDADQQVAQPFFAYLAFQAVHIPVQAPRAFTQRYEGKFASGWDDLRAARWSRAQALGLAPAGAALPSLPEGLRAWNTLSPEEQIMQSKSMAVYAGMLEAMDHEIGRLIAHLESKGQLANTVFVVTSDNGAEPSAPDTKTGFTTWMRLNSYDREIATLGEQGSHNWIGPEWAAALSTPGHLFKFYTSEGGIRVPLIVSGAGVKPGQRTNANAFVSDITPTILDMAGAPAQLRDHVSIDGRSLLPILRGQASSVYAPEDAVGIEVSGNAALIRGDLKLVRLTPPYGDNNWRLYNVASDPGETRDLSTVQPVEFAALKSAYETYAKRNGVLDMPIGYEPERQVANNAMAAQLKHAAWLLALVGLAMIAGLGFGLTALLRALRKARK
jgi:arylsulfatase/uncharacterized sulfatase